MPDNGFARGQEEILLDPKKTSEEIRYFEHCLLKKIVGQERAVQAIVKIYQILTVGLSAPCRPIANLLFLGPTGSGKTRLVEAVSETIFGSPKSFIKINCAEFQHSHEIAKLIGSPPGYLGHKETSPYITQERLDQYHTEKTRMSFVLFDEIEKANDALWQLLLGILDKATLTLGDNREVDFSRSVIFMTSNSGAKEMSDFISGGHIGFAPHTPVTQIDPGTDKKIYHAGLEAAKRNFSPEFMNRIDKTIVFRTLTPKHLGEILEIELQEVQCRIFACQLEKTFIFSCTPEAKNFLLSEGTDLKYGARHLKRAIERHLVYPLSNLISTKQIDLGDNLMVDYDSSKKELTFKKSLTKIKK